MKQPTKQQVWKWTKNASSCMLGLLAASVVWHFAFMGLESLGQWCKKQTEARMAAPVQTVERWNGAYRRVTWDGHLWVEGNGMVSHHPECPCTEDTPEQ